MFYAWSNDSTRIATSNGDKTARVWTLDGKNTVIARSSEYVFGMEWSHEHENLVSFCPEDFCLSLHDLDGARCRLLLCPSEGMVTNFSFCPIGSRIAIKCSDLGIYIHVFDPCKRGQVRIKDTLLDMDPEVIREQEMGFEWSPDGTRLLLHGKTMDRIYAPLSLRTVTEEQIAFPEWEVFCHVLSKL